MTTRRVQEVSALLMRELSVLMHNSLPEEYGIVSLTDIKLTSDLKNATCYISVLEKEKEEEVLKKLSEEKADFQKILGRKLRMKFTPKITFEFDTMQEKVNHVDKILQEIDNGS